MARRHWWNTPCEPGDRDPRPRPTPADTPISLGLRPARNAQSGRSHSSRPRVRTVSARGWPSGMRALLVHSRRRRCSMKWTSLVGALVVSLGVCSQSYGFELLDRMLSNHKGGCSSCADACEPSCEATTECDPCGDACCDPCGKKCCHPIRELFEGLHGLFDCGCCDPCCSDSCCDPCASACCDPCSDPCADACEPSCEAETACCDPCGDSCCKKKKCCGLDLLGLFSHKSCNSCSSCCSTGGCSSCGGGGAAVESSSEEAPVPAAPMQDSSARVRKSTRAHRQVSYRN